MSSSSSSVKSEERGQEWELHRLASLKAQPGSHHHFSNAEVRMTIIISDTGADIVLLLGPNKQRRAVPFSLWNHVILLIYHVHVHPIERAGN